MLLHIYVIQELSGSEILRKAKSEGRQLLMEHEAKLFLQQHGIPVIRTEIAYDDEEAVNLASQIGYPTVLKVASPEISHKSDVGGVVLNLKNADEVKAAYKTILDNVKKAAPLAKILGVAVEEMAKPSTEIALGLTRDPQFGPVIMFGLGGIFIEILKDVTFRVCPVEQAEALEMISEVKGYPILKGYRGLPAANLEILASLIVKISNLGLEYPEIKEADLNPIMVHGDEIKVADARIILS